MKKTSAPPMHHFAWVLLALLVFTTAACSKPFSFSSNKNKAYMPLVGGGNPGTTFTDPYAYCAAFGTVDKPDASYTGEPIPNSVIQGYKKAASLENSTEPLVQFKRATIWRCMNKLVYACNFGANLPCDSKANTDKTPTQAMADFCKQNPNSDFIPMSVTGHDTIYSWICNKDKPQVDKQINHADEAGYVAEIWYKVEKESLAYGLPG